MSVTATDIGFKFEPILSTSPIIPDNKYKPNKIMHEWLFAGIATGDASGGTVSIPIDFGTSFDNNHYIVITFLTKYDQLSNCDSQIWTHSDRWDNLYFPGHTNQLVALWCGNGIMNSFDWSQSLKKPLYLGRPRQQDANPGVCSFVFDTNTDTKTYSITLQGYTLERPLPFSSILQP